MVGCHGVPSVSFLLDRWVLGCSEEAGYRQFDVSRRWVGGGVRPRVDQERPGPDAIEVRAGFEVDDLDGFSTFLPHPEGRKPGVVEVLVGLLSQLTKLHWYNQDVHLEFCGRFGTDVQPDTEPFAADVVLGVLVVQGIVSLRMVGPVISNLAIMRVDPVGDSCVS